MFQICINIYKDYYGYNSILKMIEVICRNTNNNLVPVKGDRNSFRLRQRAKTQEGFKVKPLRFISFKEAAKVMNKKTVYPEVTWYSVSKL